jgi:hypothetical protein
VITHHGGWVVPPEDGIPAASLGQRRVSPCTTSSVGVQVAPGPMVTHTSPLTEMELVLDVDHDKVVQPWFRMLRNIMEVGPVLGLSQRELGVDLLVVNTKELRNQAISTLV